MMGVMSGKEKRNDHTEADCYNIKILGCEIVSCSGRCLTDQQQHTYIIFIY